MNHGHNAITAVFQPFFSRFPAVPRILIGRMEADSAYTTPYWTLPIFADVRQEVFASRP